MIRSWSNEFKRCSSKHFRQTDLKIAAEAGHMRIGGSFGSNAVYNFVVRPANILCRQSESYQAPLHSLGLPE